MQAPLDIQSHIDSMQSEIVSLQSEIVGLQSSVADGDARLAAAHQVSEDLAERTKAAFDKGDQRDLYALIHEALTHGTNRKRTRLQNEASSLSEKAEALIAAAAALKAEAESLA